MTAPRLDLGELRLRLDAGPFDPAPSRFEWESLIAIAEAAEALDKQRLANSLGTPESSYLMEIKLGLALRAALAAVRKE